MSDIDAMSDVPEVPEKKVIKKKPRKKRAFPRARIEAKAAPKPANELAGISASACANACNGDGCVISGQGYCAHPRKGGLQASSLNDPAALQRLNAAKKLIARMDLDRRYD